MPSPKLLVVDDEKSLLELLTRYLVRLGYEVAATADPKDAMVRLASDPSSFRLVVLDLSMPGVSGEEMLRKILTDFASLRVLVSSGYPFSTETLPAKWKSRVGYLQKPYSTRMLGEAVLGLLNT